MTAGEKKRMLGIVRTVECFFSEEHSFESGADIASHPDDGVAGGNANGRLTKEAVYAYTGGPSVYQI